MAAPKVLAIVLAGGEGNRLKPLTAHRAKPAVPFGGIYRLVDFALSNLVNSHYLHIVVLTQYKSHSLDRHISKTWRMSALLGNYVAPVPAQQRVGKHWYLGSADAIFQCLNIIEDERPDIVVVVGADHVYRMDFSQMVDAHIASGAELTVAGIRQPIALATEFGVIDTDPATPDKIRAFLEKPADPVGLADSPGEILASMGNYVVNADALVEAVTKDADNLESRHDMGGDIVPYFVDRGTAGVYDFIRNDVPGSTDRDRDYWRDVGTIDSYYEANKDLIAVTPVFNLYNHEWPLHTGYVGLPRPSSCTPVPVASATPPTRSCPPVSSSPARRSSARCSPPGCTCTPGRPCRTASCSTTSRCTGTPRSTGRSSTRTSSSRSAPASASTPMKTAPAASRSPSPASPWSPRGRSSSNPHRRRGAATLRPPLTEPRPLCGRGSVRPGVPPRLVR